MQSLSQVQLKYIFQKNNLQYIKKIGSGGFGTVYLANCMNKQFLPLGVKCISKKKIKERPSLEKYLSSEIQSMESIKHANIVKFYRTFTDHENLFLVMEYCELGNLYSYQYAQHDKIIKLQEALKIFIQVIKGVRAIHKLNIIHRDMKCENILLKKIFKTTKYICKICDFGFAKEIDNTAKSQCGTPNFMAPEVLAGKHYDKTIDIWSMGVILFYMLYGEYPFKGLNILYDIEMKCSSGFSLSEELARSPLRKKNKSIKSQHEQKIADLLFKIFVLEPNKRITLDQILKHSLFKEFDLEEKSESSTQSLESVEESAQFLLKKEQFLTTTFKEVENLHLFNGVNLLAIEFYFKRASATILKNGLKEVTEEQQKLKIAHKYQTVTDCLNILKKELLKENKYTIPLKSNKISYSSTETFQAFKDEYRIVLGHIFSQVHNKIHPESEREKIKLKVLCCHTINRVFENSNSEYFSIYFKWLKNNNFSQAQMLDFNRFNAWINAENSQNLFKTTSLINSHFYGKK